VLRGVNPAKPRQNDFASSEFAKILHSPVCRLRAIFTLCRLRNFKRVKWLNLGGAIDLGTDGKHRGNCPQNSRVFCVVCFWRDNMSLIGSILKLMNRAPYTLKAHMCFSFPRGRALQRRGPVPGGPILRVLHKSKPSGCAPFSRR